MGRYYDTYLNPGRAHTTGPVHLSKVSILLKHTSVVYRKNSCYLNLRSKPVTAALARDTIPNLPAQPDNLPVRIIGSYHMVQRDSQCTPTPERARNALLRYFPTGCCIIILGLLDKHVDVHLESNFQSSENTASPNNKCLVFGNEIKTVTLDKRARGGHKSRNEKHRGGGLPTENNATARKKCEAITTARKRKQDVTNTDMDMLRQLNSRVKKLFNAAREEVVLEQKEKWWWLLTY
ncbi:hypothetical protein BDN72DRAFT_932764 [Pluteus cervinus]|uniref:Uncharacterized protein n=1 Tax=Pluteus cervinus TaxID=181527 RepID=A0ACD3A939_9AGAR|nr:hypothetical protein BDN72DRAFT_932764 [Pluteus cervinus]